MKLALATACGSPGAACGVSKPGPPHWPRVFARGRGAGASDPALAKMPSSATVGDPVATAGGPAQRSSVNVVIPEGSVTLASAETNVLVTGWIEFVTPQGRLDRRRPDSWHGEQGVVNLLAPQHRAARASPLPHRLDPATSTDRS